MGKSDTLIDMRTMTATEASRNFAALLDLVEQGETFVITRAGRRVASVGPVAAGNGAAVIELLRRPLPDEEFAADVMSAREAVVWDVEWPAD